jgi:hypothetical protein
LDALERENYISVFGSPELGSESRAAAQSDWLSATRRAVVGSLASESLIPETAELDYRNAWCAAGQRARGLLVIPDAASSPPTTSPPGIAPSTRCPQAYSGIMMSG